MVYNVVMVSDICQHESAIYIYIYPPSCASLPPTLPSHLPLHLTPLGLTEHWARLPMLYNSFPQAIYFTQDGVYVNVISLFKKYLIFNWLKIALQFCVDFCHTTTHQS